MSTEFLLGLSSSLVSLALATSAAPQNVKLTPPLAPGYGRIQFAPATSPDGRFVVYHADRDGDGDLELYSVPPTGGQPPILLADDIVPLGSEYGPLVTLDSSRVLHVAGPDASGAR